MILLTRVFFNLMLQHVGLALIAKLVLLNFDANDLVNPDHGDVNNVCD